MRGAIALALLVCGAASATAEPWSVVGADAYGCKSTKDLAQLRLMSAVKAAFDIALAEKLDAGRCVTLQPGEPASKDVAASRANRVVFKVNRADGTAFFVDARVVERTL